MSNKKIFSSLAMLITIFGVVVTIFPLLWVVNTAFMGNEALYGDRLNFFPNPPSLESYFELNELIPYWRIFLNTTFVSLAQTLGILIISVLAAYGFSRFKWPGRDLVFYIYVVSMTLPVWPLLIPMFLTVSKFGWLDSYQGLIVPGLISPLTIFLLRQFLNSLPRELDEAALIDGASRFRTLISIILPNMKAGVMAAGILAFLASWNNLIWPMLIIKNPNMTTIPLALTQLTISGSGWVKIYWGPLMMASLLGSIPTVLLFVVFQRQLIAGITFSGIKQ